MQQPPAAEMPRPERLPDTPQKHLASETTRDVLRIQHKVLMAIRRHLDAEGFVEIRVPIIGPVTDPGARGAKQVDIDYYGRRYKLMTSAILYKQASLLAFDKIFCIAPNVRLEPLETAGTSRHLAEFNQIDVEAAGHSREQIMKVAQEIVVCAVREAVESMPKELERLGRDTDLFGDLLRRPFDLISHADAVSEVGGDPHAEIDWEGEARISRKATRPFFVTDYPKGSRGFYDRESRELPGVLRNFDLLAPEGYGELASGGEREFEYARIVTRMRETGENASKYAWYLDMVRDGIPDSAGFGIGLERLTRYITGVEHIWEACAYPKLPGVYSP
ncbi:asparagine synthetase A [Streptomyces formicae]|uniref:Asparagine--tRNA ligase related protein n=1 Tax=Streptomyces formicae TaxID=1616117 RepID=A0A291Q1Z2_9ACTN|nr:asparagine synthetase A [Streptomyces formicae]ATL25506.1 Asparagine--tRNA ligase related protein [Streptomyces formicae]